MKRRDFLQQLVVSPMVARTVLTGSSVFAGIKNAVAANGKTLIVIFQRGGCDGLNMVVPYQEDNYYASRPDIAIKQPGNGNESALDIDGFFGFHPQMKGLLDIYNQGNMAILPAVHYAEANRSHFNSQDFIESGVANTYLNTGWLNRYLALDDIQNNLRGISFNAIQHSLRGDIPVLAMNDLSKISQFYDSSDSELGRIYQQESNEFNLARSLIQKNGLVALDGFSSLSSISPDNYHPDNGAVYPDSSFARQLRDTAQLIKEGIGLEVVTVSNDGWDHHANQGGAVGAQADKLATFSLGLEAFYTDLGSYLSDVVILTISEFGRTVKQNASLGTDHGNASCWFVMGGDVKGGIYGDWPGLDEENLYLGRYLKHTVEFTDVYAEILAKHLAVQSSELNTILPGSSYSPIGFL